MSVFSVKLSLLSAARCTAWCRHVAWSGWVGYGYRVVGAGVLGGGPGTGYWVLHHPTVPDPLYRTHCTAPHCTGPHPTVPDPTVPDPPEPTFLDPIDPLVAAIVTLQPGRLPQPWIQCSKRLSILPPLRIFKRFNRPSGPKVLYTYTRMGKILSSPGEESCHM